MKKNSWLLALCCLVSLFISGCMGNKQTPQPKEFVVLPAPQKQQKSNHFKQYYTPLYSIAWLDKEVSASYLTKGTSAVIENMPNSLPMVSSSKQFDVKMTLFEKGYHLIGTTDFSATGRESLDSLKEFAKELGASHVYVRTSPTVDQSTGRRMTRYEATYAYTVNLIFEPGFKSRDFPESGIAHAGVIVAVMKDTAAYYANLNKGDIILTVEGIPYGKGNMAAAELDFGSHVDMVIVRNGVQLKKALDIRSNRPQPGSQQAYAMLQENILHDQQATQRRVSPAPSAPSPDTTQRQAPPQQSNRQVLGTGSGFFISPDGYFVTNAHVVQGGTSFSVVNTEGTAIHEASLIFTDTRNDIAILKIQNRSQYLPLAASFEGKRGDEVMTLGYPSPSIQGAKQKATFGRINALTGIQDDPRLIQVDLPVQPGNSGGPLIDKKGKVIGIVTARLNGDYQNVNYALKIDYLNSMLKSHNLASLSGNSSFSDGLLKAIVPDFVAQQDFSKVAEKYEKAVGLVVTYR